MAIRFESSRVRDIPGRDDRYTLPEYWKNDYLLWELRDAYKGSGDEYTGWYVLATFQTEDELKLWAQSFYSSYPFAYPKALGQEGPKATPVPRWVGTSDRTKILKNLPRHAVSGAPGRTFNPEFRTEGYGVEDDAGPCKVYDVVKDGKEVGCYLVETFPNFQVAKVWAMTYFGCTAGTKGGAQNKYVAPLPPLDASKKKLLLLI